MFDLNNHKSSGSSRSERSDRRRSIYRSDTHDTYASANKSDHKAYDESGGTEDWLITYSDAMTLLLTFFVLILSFSEIDQTKFEQVQGAIQGEMLKKQQSRPFSEAHQELKLLIEQQKAEEQVEVERTNLGIKLRLESSSLYQVGSAQIQEGKLPLLKDVAQIIQQMNMEDFVVEVEGHTDDVPITSNRYPSNWELSAHRATNVVRYLIDQGVEASHLKAAGFADSRPLVPNRDQFGEPIPENQAKNRRVVIYIRRQASTDAGSGA
jgi:chemotaxis protein MotB